MTAGRVQTVTIANGQPTSTAVSGEWGAAYMLILPGTFTGTSITFTVCDTAGGTFVPLYEVSDDAVGTSAAVKALVTQGTAVILPDALVCAPFFKIVSSGNEAADRSLVICGKMP